MIQDLYLSFKPTGMGTSCPRKVSLLKDSISCSCFLPWWKLRLRSKRSLQDSKPFSISSKSKDSLQTMIQSLVFIYRRNQQRNLTTLFSTSICFRQSFSSTKRFNQTMLLTFHCQISVISSWNELNSQQKLIKSITHWSVLKWQVMLLLSYHFKMPKKLILDRQANQVQSISFLIWWATPSLSKTLWKMSPISQPMVQTKCCVIKLIPLSKRQEALLFNSETCPLVITGYLYSIHLVASNVSVQHLSRKKWFWQFTLNKQFLLSPGLISCR